MIHEAVSPADSTDSDKDEIQRFETNDNMTQADDRASRVYVISIDLVSGTDIYAIVAARLEKLGAVRILFSQWACKTWYTSEELRLSIQPVLTPRDRLFIAEINTSNCVGVNMRTDLPQ